MTIYCSDRKVTSRRFTKVYREMTIWRFTKIIKRRSTEFFYVLKIDMNRFKSIWGLMLGI